MRVIKGTVIKGEKIGRRLGYPTANLSRRVFGKRLAAHGVYAAEAVYGQKTYKALVVVGMPGSTRRIKGKVEVYLLNFRGNLYGRRLTVSMYQKLRGLRKFSKVSALKDRIRRDIRQVKRLVK